MERDNKVLLGAVLILLVGMLSFNFNSLTGKAIKDPQVSMQASPSNLYFSSEDLELGTKIVAVTLNVKSGKIDNELQLYRETSAGEERVGGEETICRGSASSCGKGIYTVNYKFSSSYEEGDYFFRAQKRDYSLQDRVVFDTDLVTVTHYEAQFRGDV